MVLLGASAGVVGCFTLLRRRALAGDAIAHSVLPGVCLAFMLTGVKNPFVLLAGAVATGWLSLWVIDVISANSRIKPDTAIGLVLSVFFGVGILLLTVIQQSGNAAQSGLDKFLFGKAASMLSSDVYVFGTLAALIITVVALLFKHFTLLAFDENFARVIGLPVRALETLLATLTVLAVATGIQAVGVVLMSAMLITPAAAARFWTNRLRVMLPLAALFGAVAGVAGAFISYLMPAMPTGPWVVVALTFIALVSMLFAPKRGLLAKWLQNRQNRLKMLEENVLKMFYYLYEQQTTPQLPLTAGIEQLLTIRNVPLPQLKTGLRRLKAKKWIVAQQGVSGWQLTPAGMEKARHVVRLHRLWELYLSQHLKLAADHVHDDAEAMEHLLTPEMEQQLDNLLGYPHTDPHNSNIPR
ncbi:zinc ABC transporter permease [Sphingobacteriales bacterium UPWRP_1]|nr:zinc ABC transporter permease [Sphingobacteriales bacterium TSM_CSM]PSJ75555.1 zinc ABC transporter permease [Sphingobacteriales bacterium UPWRP_1]